MNPELRPLAQVSSILVRGTETVVTKVPFARAVYWRYAPAYYRSKYATSYDGVQLDPLRLIEVDPTDIQRFTGRAITIGSNRRHNIGVVESGEWDQSDRPLSDDGIYPSIRDRFTRDLDWKDTELYQRTQAAINSGGSFWHGCETYRQLEERCARIDDLYDTVRAEGYRSNFERRAYPYINCFLNEVCIDIGRDGQLLFVDGRHRLAIAQVLGLDAIPVFPVVRHTEWMDHHRTVAAGDASPDHPDVLDV